MKLENAPPARGRSAFVYLWGPFVLAQTVGCILGDHKCGAHQVQTQDADEIVLCVCEPGAVALPDGSCKPCGENEEPNAGQCACKSGYARETPESDCEESAIGQACNAMQSCSEPYPYCVASAGGDGYCTATDCENNADCPSGFTCEREGAMRFCKRLPTGVGVTCASADDCASFDATYCETFQAKACLLQKCATGDIKCPNEWGCCDFGALLGVSFCLPPDTLVGGTCPGGGRLVPP